MKTKFFSIQDYILMKCFERKLYLFIFFTCVWLPGNLMAQTDQNYVRTRIPRIPITDQSMLDAGTSDRTKVQSSYTYIDEFGRTVQSISSQQSPSGKDMVQVNMYDVMGRESKKWLPYTIANGTAGNIRLNAQTEVNSFYNPSNPKDPTVATTAVPFSETVYDKSPLNRVVEQGFPGESWQLGTNRTIKTTYGTNSSGEIRMWSITSSGVSSSTYPAGNLLSTALKDENGNTVTQYKDFDGRLICKKVQSGTSTFLYTDYVYDDAGNLRYVIPPLPTLPVAVSLPASFTENDAVFKNFFYGYHYDGRNRMTEKKMPGKGWEYYVYNKLDQVVLSQSPSQLALGVWEYFKFDSRGRIILTGEYTTSALRNDLQGTVDGFSGALWDSFNNATTNMGYTDNSYPDNTLGGQKKTLSVNYYDNYNFLSNTSINPNTAVYVAPTVDTIYKAPAGLLTGSLTNVIGAASPTYLLTLNQYDNYGRNVKTTSQSFKGGATNAGHYDVVENQYAFFGGQTVRSKRQHYLAGALQLTVTNWLSYDLTGRKILFQQQYNTGPIVSLAQYSYNEAGQLAQKSLHAIGQSTATDITLDVADAVSSGNKIVTASNSITFRPGFFVNQGATFQASISKYLQNITYRYNIRGWLTKVNDPVNWTGSNLFAEQIDYDQLNAAYPGTQAQFNGNISSMSWQTLAKPGIGTQELRGYVFTYDPLNRLTSASYKSGSGNDKYNEVLSYDELGNILSLNRNATSSTYLNKLIYDYGAGAQRGNQLLGVTDNDGSEHYTSTFSYYPSGSEKSNSKMLVTSVAYNELNLPSQITLSSGKTMTFTYTSTGEKIERVIKQGTTVAEDRSYIHGVEYAGNNIDFVHTDEGRARPGSNGYVMEYQLSDHLGNVRAVFGDEDNSGSFSASNDIVQLTDYYAFGRPISYLESNPLYQYKFNGKEYATDLNAYDYGARYFNPVTARWNAVDNDADKSRRWNPYSYAYNNPIRNIDPDGNFGYDYSTAYANAVSSMLNQIGYNATNQAAYEFELNAEDAQYAQGQIDHPAYRPQEANFTINGEPIREFNKFYLGNGGGNNGGSRGLAGFSAGGDGDGMFGNMASFLLHLTPFGGVVDFANAAKSGNVGGAVLGLASTATFFTGEGEVNNAFSTVYRGTSQTPSLAFENGFTAKGANTSLISHSFNAPDSYFIPTSFSKDVATSFRSPGSFVYTIRQPASGIDLNTKFGFDYEFYHEYEWAVPGSIPGSAIHGAQQILPGGGLGEYIYNPNFK